MRYLALSTLVEVETCEYRTPEHLDRDRPTRRARLRKMFRAETAVYHYDREQT
jgi:hypothetical protein